MRYSGRVLSVCVWFDIHINRKWWRFVGMSWEVGFGRFSVEKRSEFLIFDDTTDLQIQEGP